MTKMSFINSTLLSLRHQTKGMFSKTCEYAIRALIFIAGKSKQRKKVGIKEIASGTNAPEHFIAKILHQLTKQGLVHSLKGPSGGFYLKDKSLNISLAEIVTAIDGDKLLTGCGLGLDSCSEKTPCPIHKEFKKVRNEIRELLQSAKLAELQVELENKMTYLKRY